MNNNKDDAPEDVPERCCPNCDSEDVEWIEITGDVANPTGSIYRCNECDEEFSIPGGATPRYEY